MTTDDSPGAPAHSAVDRVTAALTAHTVDPRIRWFDTHATTATEAARLLGVEVGAIANSLVFELDGQPLLVMTSGAHRVDTGWLGEQLGGVIRRASPEVVAEATGQVIGGVAPVGHPAPLRTIVDQDLARYPEIWAAAGHARTVFPLTFDLLVRITGGQVLPVERPS